MPTYVYKCLSCGRKTEFTLDMDEEDPTMCPQVGNVGDPCGGKLTKVFQMPNVIYRAGGFRTTDARLEPTEDDLDE